MGFCFYVGERAIGVRSVTVAMDPYMVAAILNRGLKCGKVEALWGSFTLIYYTVCIQFSTCSVYSYQYLMKS